MHAPPPQPWLPLQTALVPCEVTTTGAEPPYWHLAGVCPQHMHALIAVVWHFFGCYRLAFEDDPQSASFCHSSLHY